MSDISTNVSGGGKFMRQEYPGTIAMSYLPVGTSVKWTQLKSNGWIRPDLAQPGTIRTNPAYKVTFTPRLYTNATNYIDHAQCVFFYVRFCGDGKEDKDRGEQCDDGNMVSGDGCSNICEKETPPAASAVCNNLTVTPTSVSNNGSITYTCTGTNVTSYSIIAKKPDGTVFASHTSATGTITIPANPAGTYSVSCFVNGQVTTPASCQKTVVNTTTTPEAICTNLTVTPTSFVSGGNVTYTCTGNNVTSWSVEFAKPGGDIFQRLTTSTGSVTIPASPLGTYTAKCFINGQTSTPAACQKTVENTASPTPKINIDKRDANPNDLDGNIGNDTQTVTSGTPAIFKIRVTNNGTEDLKNIVLSDAAAPSCAGNVTLPSTYPGTWSNFAQGGSGNHSDGLLQVGEWFEYTCDRGNTTAGYTNSATVSATGVTSGIPVNATDTTPVLIPGTTTPTPQIEVIKDDNDNHDDMQYLTNGGTAQFTIVVKNPGTEALENVVLNDPYAPECNRNSAQTLAMIVNVGNRDNRLDPGESFSYICTRSNVDQSTFPNNENRICVQGQGSTSGTTVNSCDTTRVMFTVNPQSNYCTLSSSSNYGGAPLRAKLDCQSNIYAQCHIRILKDGKPWGNVAGCYADMVFDEK